MITERRARHHTWLLVAIVVGAAASIAHAHGTERKGARSLLRLQGYTAAPPAGTNVVQEMVLVARGVEHRFWATDRRRLELASPSTTPRPERDRLALQGDFEILARFAKLRGDQLVTILGEQRVGSADLFVLTLDTCPP